MNLSCSSDRGRLLTLDLRSWSFIQSTWLLFHPLCCAVVQKRKFKKGSSLMKCYSLFLVQRIPFKRLNCKIANILEGKVIIFQNLRCIQNKKLEIVSFRWFTYCMMLSTTKIWFNAHTLHKFLTRCGLYNFANFCRNGKLNSSLAQQQTQLSTINQLSKVN